ncbi:hypothetical protein KJ632_03640 [Patescibacteria group bacterium]|nr:hypothetical protein [Patescibacteria group bacterium]
MSDKRKLIRHIYLYLVTAITIVLILISTIGFINLFLRKYVLDVKPYDEFTKPYECEEQNLLYRYDGNVQQKKNPNLSKVQEEELIAQCEADEEINRELRNKNDLKRDIAQYLAMLLVALPLYFYHWGIIKKEK